MRIRSYVILLTLLLLTTVQAQNETSPFGTKPDMFGSKPDPFAQKVQPFNSKTETAAESTASPKSLSEQSSQAMERSCLRSGKSKDFCSCQAQELSKLTQDSKRISTAAKSQDPEQLRELAQEMSRQSARVMKKCERFEKKGRGNQKKNNGENSKIIGTY